MDNTQDIIDVRDIIARVEELESELESAHEADKEEGGTNLELVEWIEACRADAGPAHENDHFESAREYLQLSSLLSDLKGYSGDEQWRGDWYPVTLIRDSYFKDYAQELAEDTGAIDSNAQWPNTCIDWDQAARELQMDYSSVEVDGVTYWYR